MPTTQPRPLSPALAADLSRLLEDPGEDAFGAHLLAAAKRAAKLREMTAFLMPHEGRGAPLLTLAAGALGDYRLRQNARDSALTDRFRERFDALAKLTAQGTQAAGFTVTTPGAGDPNAPIYTRSNLIGRVSAVQRTHRSVHVLNFYRHADDGPFTEEEIERLRDLMPVLVGILALRHRIFGWEATPKAPAQGHVHAARARDHPHFSRLSPREAEVCDRLVAGLDAPAIAQELGLSETTVRTFRARAYAKLGISSLSQLFALVLDGYGSA